MILEVIKKEILANIKSPKIVITYIVCAALILTALLTGAMTYLTLKEEAKVLAKAEKERLSEIYDFQNDFLNRGMHVYRRPAVLSALISGVGGDAAQRGVVTNFLNPGFDVSKFNSTPILAVFGWLDLGLIVKIILSLFVILFTFDAISGEKEQGTLKLAFANQVKRSSYLIGKLIGNFLLLLFPFIIPLLLGLLIIQFLPGIIFSGEDWVRLGLVVLAFILYLLVFFSLGMMVSALTKRSTVSFLVLLMIWVLFIGIIPRMSVLAAQNIYPVPPIDDARKSYGAEFGPAYYEFMSSINEMVKPLREEGRRRLPSPPLIRNEQTQKAYDEKMKAYQAWAKKVGAEVMDNMVESYEKFALKMQLRGQQIAHEQNLKQEQQNQLAIGLSRLSSPAAALTFAVNRLSKTGVYSSDKVFKDSVDDMVKGFRDYSNEKMKENPMRLSFGQQTDVMDASEVYPNKNAFAEEPLEVSIWNTMQDFAVLALLSIVFFAVAFIAFLRYDVR